MLDRYEEPMEEEIPGATDFNAALKAEAEGDKRSALIGYEKAAKENCTRAMVNLGVMFVDGTESQKDRAESLFKRAADLYDISGWRNLGYINAVGLTVPRDKRKGIEFYTKAAEMGSVKAQCNLGVMYRHGNGTEVDFVEALKWYRMSAEAGYFRAQASLADMLIKGEGCEPDPEGCVYWYTKAAEQGSKRAIYRLAHLMIDGEHVPKDEEKAWKMLFEDAERGYRRAIFEVGEKLESEGEDEESVAWYIKGAAAGETRCKDKLTERGIPLPPSRW